MEGEKVVVIGSEAALATMNGGHHEGWASAPAGPAG